jgi:hypothetical protein
MKINDLKTLFEEFIKLFPPEICTNGITYPFYCDKESTTYEGYDAIIVGDDTEISQYGLGLFKVLDYHNEDDIEILNGEDIISYYLGIDSAYPLDLHENKPLVFRKAYKKQLLALINLVDTDN